MPLKKLAIFVEGQTEAIFAERICKEIAGGSNVEITQLLSSGGASCARTITVIKGSSSIDPNTKYYVQIHNSCGMERVVSDVKDRHRGLVDQGFTQIIGIRDLHPKPRNTLKRLRRGVRRELNPLRPRPSIVIAVMEIETWFLAECSHFERMDPKLTRKAIKKVLGIDLWEDDLEKIDAPAEALHKIYSTVGLSYRKKRDEVQALVHELDCALIYLGDLGIQSLNELKSLLAGFFAIDD